MANRIGNTPPIDVRLNMITFLFELNSVRKNEFDSVEAHWSMSNQIPQMADQASHSLHKLYCWLGASPLGIWLNPPALGSWFADGIGGVICSKDAGVAVCGGPVGLAGGGGCARTAGSTMLK
jgi:hypothetical protein